MVDGVDGVVLVVAELMKPVLLVASVRLDVVPPKNPVVPAL